MVLFGQGVEVDVFDLVFESVMRAEYFNHMNKVFHYNFIPSKKNSL